VKARVAIIGAGLAGLTAADRLLKKNGIKVVVIDKGRHVGGRFCTRKLDLPGGETATFDLGPQLLYTRRPGEHSPLAEVRIGALLRRLSAGSEADTTYPAGVHLTEDDPLAHHQIMYIGGSEEPVLQYPPAGCTIPGGMREIAFQLLRQHHGCSDFRFHEHTLAERLQRTEYGWKIHTRSLLDGSEDDITAKVLILTAPVPQALELLTTNKIELPDELASLLRKVQYSRCIALYGMFAGAGPVVSGGVWSPEGPLEWVVDNAQKGVSPARGAFTALTTSDWATEHWAETDAQIVDRLLPALQAACGAPIPGVPISIQRWKWARPIHPLPTSCMTLRDLSLILAGDGFAGLTPDPGDAALNSGGAAAVRAAGLLTALRRDDNRLMLSWPPTRFTLEIAVSTPDEARQAAICGADRLELSSGLEVGGLTPSSGLFHAVYVEVKLPIYVLLRPRTGGFWYTDDEFQAMLDDAREFVDAGVAGLVFGILKSDGTIDRERCKRLVELAPMREDSRCAVFHRAFDFVPDQFMALDELIDLGFERVLTSGAGSTAEAGTTRLSALVQHAGWQIEILPAGDIRPENVAELVRATCCHQVHSSAGVHAPEPSLARNPRVASGMGVNAAGMRRTASMEVVGALRAALDTFATSLSSSS
jgi:copper homeostasis protein